MFFKSVCFLLHFPNSEIFSSSSHEIFPLAFNIWNPHNLGWWEFMLKFHYLFKAFVWLAKIKIYDVNLVLHWICVVRGYSHLEFVILPISESHGIVLEVASISVDLLCQSILYQRIKVILKLRFLLNLSCWVTRLQFLVTTILHILILLLNSHQTV